MTLTLRAENGALLARSVRTAGSFWSRFLGLMGRSDLPPGEGLYLPGTNSIHMLFMRFPIDCVFLGGEEPDGTRRVVAVHHGVPPWRGVVWYVRGAKSVVELPAGTCAAAALSARDRVRLEAVPR